LWIGAFIVFGTLQTHLFAEHPNIVVILADDLGYGDVGFNGCSDIPTPNIDSFARNGVLCTDGYVTHPFCSPSRAALLTGRYQQRFGYEHQPNLVGNVSDPLLGLPPNELLLPQILKPAGYVSGLIGKWHLGISSNLQPTARGFDEFFGFLGADSHYYNAPVLRNTTSLTETSYLTDAFTREAVSFINAHASEPFFLLIAYNAPHAPYDQPPQAYMNRVATIPDPTRKIYAAMVVAIDDGVGQVLQTLRSQNLLSNTLIFFLSDNGAPPGGGGSNAPLRGFKMNVLEGAIRVPFAIQWNGRLPAGMVSTPLISALDIVPTAAAVAGVSLPNDRPYDGLNLLPLLTEQQPGQQRTLFWRVFGLGSTGPPASQSTIWGVRSGPLKLVTEEATVNQPAALYNLPNDSGESLDLAASQPTDVSALSALYAQWNAQLISPLWFKNSDFLAKTPGSLVLAGDWNGFKKADGTAPWQLTLLSAPSNPTPDAFDWFTNTVYAASVGGDTTPGQHSFTFIANSNYSYQWGGATLNIDATTSVPAFSSTSLGPTNSISFENGYYYSFRVIDHMNSLDDPLTVAVLKTSARPITVSVTSQMPASPAANNAVAVSIATNQPKSPQERIYLRWSSDFFVTSNMVKAVGSGVSYSATIPPQPAGRGVQYRIITSTADLSPFVTSSTVDALTLATSGTFKFVAGGADPTPTPIPTPTPAVRVTMQTSPAGRSFTVDGTTYSSTHTFSWQPGSTHTIAAISPQNGGTGVQYVWKNWSDNGNISHMVAPATNKTYTATFTTQYYLTLSSGSGGTVSPSSGWRNSGAVVSINATPTHTTLVSYNFTGWTGAGTGSYSGVSNPASISMTGPITESAAFTQNPVEVTVQPNPAGRSFTVDGTAHSSIQTFSWQPGSSHTIATTSPQSGGNGVQYVWKKWSDNGSISHTVAPATNKTYTAIFTTQYYLTMSAATGGTVSPSSGWRNSGTAISITATPAAGYIFSNWAGSGTGSYSGSANPGSITPSGPIHETATFAH
jgi:arylsulfatase A-like enzyme